MIGSRRARYASGGSAPGPATDAAGQSSYDPTDNVLDKVRDSERRQDDLREAESRHVREIMKVRAENTYRVQEAERDRLDAIREVDSKAVQQAAGVAETRATALAGQVAASAEAMRSQVAAAAAAAATALASALSPISTAIEQLRQAMYEAQGQKTQIVETRDVNNSQMSLVYLGAAALALAGIYLVSQIGGLKRSQTLDDGRQVQKVDQRDQSKVQWQVIAGIVGIAAVFSSGLFAAAAIAVTLILHG